MTNASHFDYPGWTVITCQHSIDAHSHAGALSVSWAFLPIKAANTLIMFRNQQIAWELPDKQDQKSLSFCWRSSSKWGRVCVSHSFANRTSRFWIFQ